MKLSAPKERDITASIRDYLRIRKIFHWKNWSGLGSTPGIPDIIGVLPGGRALFIEVKTAKGHLSDHQENFLKNAGDMGAMCIVARSVQDLIERGL